jgi:hypothetical protein
MVLLILRAGIFLAQNMRDRSERVTPDCICLAQQKTRAL